MFELLILVTIRFTIIVQFTRVHSYTAYEVLLSPLVSSFMPSGIGMDMFLSILTHGLPCSFLSMVSLQLMGRLGLSYLLFAIDIIEM